MQGRNTINANKSNNTSKHVHLSDREEKFQQLEELWSYTSTPSAISSVSWNWIYAHLSLQQRLRIFVFEIFSQQDNDEVHLFDFCLDRSVSGQPKTQKGRFQTWAVRLICSLCWSPHVSLLVKTFCRWEQGPLQSTFFKCINLRQLY